MQSPEKPYRVVELRGLACLLLVAYHVVGIPGAGMQVGDDSIYRYATSSFDLIRMPVFTFLSGLVYAYRPVRRAELAEFSLKKLRRLGVPFLIISTLFYLLQTHAPGAHGTFAPAQMWRIYLFPYAHFWYLQALLLIFAMVAALEVAGLLDRPERFIIAFVASVAGCLTFWTDSNLFSVDIAVTLLPHFLLGLAVTRFGAQVPRAARVWAAGVALAAGVAVHQASLLGFLDYSFGWNSGVALLCGMGGAVTLLHAMPHSRIFRLIGRSSYPIYLHHALFTAGARMVLHRMGAGDLVVFLVALVAGITGPMILESLASLRPLTRVTLIGKA
ncbi:acyltransferase [Azospirillum thermophilum]|uniref:Acyltransferase n=1 Tax=Azospirillum thermophilum TaxID=2202148 RepID=A0A2S2CRK4_9PROT|nr:acyltransferase [Azospirillum thermophilum]